ncbi:MAG: acyl carrier protein [Myxococcales bacterium]|nr:acyl carrier protein [Myxococcales bacterium]
MANSTSDLASELKALIVQTLNLEDVDPKEIDTDAPLFGAGLGLDSIDALEIGLAVSKRYGVKMKDDSAANKQHFASISALAAFIEGARA